MSFTQTQVDEAFAALGLGPPDAGELTAIECINGPVVFVGYSQSGQQFEFPVLRPPRSSPSCRKFKRKSRPSLGCSMRLSATSPQTQHSSPWSSRALRNRNLRPLS